MTVIATAGHVDHGKSSLVQSLTGTDPDRLEEEKRRGLTIDLGFAHTVLPSGAELSFIDVPGHVKFLRNMLAGVGGVTACVFVVAATEGWKPQSEEHLRILELLGIQNGIIALTKVDLVDDEWLELAELEVAEHVVGTFLEDSPMLPVSSITGVGMDEMRVALDELIARSAAAADRKRPRLWLDRVFAAKGSGTVGTGTLVGGTLRNDQLVSIEPGGHSARVRTIQTAGQTVDEIGAGNRVAVNLAGVDHNDLKRGDAVIEPDRWRLTSRFDASLRVLDALDHDVSRRGAYVAYIGSGEYAVKLRVLGVEELSPGSTGAVRLFLPAAVPLLPGDRFVLRESGRDETIGGGEVLDIDPVLRASRAAPDRSIDRLVSEHGWLTIDEIEQLTGEVVDPVIGEWVTSPESLAELTAMIIARVEEAGPTGVDLAAFDDRERAILPTLDEVVVTAGLAQPADAIDPYEDHPVLAELLGGGFMPPSLADVDRNDLRELVRRGHVIQRDGIGFHRDAIEAAGYVAAELLAEHVDGFTVAQFRDATGASRKYVLPLVAELDARGVTRRREDVRIGGPRLPPV
jgi:selenocysteine-specific elongation factor